jgi:3-phosphoshikimate 1-carboxyvinyltransferase
MQNSGTGTNMFTVAAALGNAEILFDGDNSLRSRPMGSILSAVETLGAKVKYLGEIGKPPYVIKGPIRGGEVKIDGNNSQYLSSLLLVAPLLDGKTRIVLDSLFERPYVEMTLWWLDRMKIKYIADFNRLEFVVDGNQRYFPFDETVAGDFSSATFPAVAAILTDRRRIDIHNIDFSDPQGDKQIFALIEKMGANVQKTPDGAIVYRDNELQGLEIDLNSMPDALPAVSVLATQANCATKIHNVAQARIKETDRIAIMTKELTKMGAKIEELYDGMIIYPSKLHAASVSGHDDHRIVMALSLAATVADGETVIDTAEAANVTYPNFADDFRKLGADIETVDA